MSSCSNRQTASPFAGRCSSRVPRSHRLYVGGFVRCPGRRGNRRSLFAAPSFSGFRRARRDDIVHLMNRSCAMRARFAVAILSLALLYASTCWATCAICVGSSATAETTSHDCEHAASHPADGSHQQHPATPDCFGHHDASFELVQGDGLAQLHVSATSHAQVNPLAAGAARAETFGPAASSLSDLAPPQLATISPQQKITILRI
jgi:hypothetical protein